MPQAREHGTEGRYILNPAYMRSYVALEGKGELPRTESETGRAPEVGLGCRMFQVAKSRLDENMRCGSRAEDMTGSALCRWERWQARMWAQEDEDTCHDANLCVHQPL